METSAKFSGLKMFTTLHHLHVNYNWNYSIVYIDCFTLCKHACVHSAIVTCTCTCTCTCMYVQCIPYSTRGNCAKNCVCRFLLPVSRKCNCYTLIHHLDISIDHQFQVQVQFKFCNLWGATTEILFPQKSGSVLKSKIVNETYGLKCKIGNKTYWCAKWILVPIRTVS